MLLADFLITIPIMGIIIPTMGTIKFFDLLLSALVDYVLFPSRSHRID